MKRILLIAPLVLAACSSMSDSHEKHETSKSAYDQMSTQDYGGVTVTVDGKGSWTKLATSASAALVDDDPKSIDDAFRRARSSAYQNIVKFMSVTVSSKTRTAVTNDNDTIVHHGTDEITERASAIVKGVEFDDQHVEGDHVVVHAVVYPNTIDTANQVRNMMAQPYFRR